MTVDNGAEKAFLELHAAQLNGAGVPSALQKKLATMLVGEDSASASSLEQRETGEAFELVDYDGAGEGELSLRLAAKRTVAKESGIFLLEHAWTPGLLGDKARAQLEQIEPLRETLWNLLQVEKTLSERERELVYEYRQGQDILKMVPGLTQEIAVRCLRESFGDLVTASMMAMSGSFPGLSSDQPVTSNATPKSGFPEGMALCKDYCWQQDNETVQVFVALPLGDAEKAEKGKIASKLTGDAWSLSYDGKVIVEGKLSAKVAMDSLWQFHNDCTLLMHLEKQEEGRWSAVLEDEERVAAPSQCSVRFFMESAQGSGDEEENDDDDQSFVTEKELADFIMRRLEKGTALGQYYVVATSEGVSGVWFIHSEFGCGLELLPYQEAGIPPAADAPLANCACKVFINQNTGMAMTIFWPLVDLEEGDFVSCNRISKTWEQEHARFERQ